MDDNAKFDAFLYRHFGIGQDPAPTFFGIDPAGPVAAPPPSPAAAHEAREAQRSPESTEADYARVDALISRLSPPPPTKPEFDKHGRRLATVLR
jgi:hypothetical protein